MAYLINCETGLGRHPGELAPNGQPWRGVNLGDYVAFLCSDHTAGLDDEQVAWKAAEVCGLTGWYEALGLDPSQDGAAPAVVARR